jgi:hypothetical protein
MAKQWGMERYKGFLITGSVIPTFATRFDWYSQGIILRPGRLGSVVEIKRIQGSLDAHAAVADGVLVDLSLWGTSIIGLAVQCPDGKYFGSIRTPRNVYDRVLEFLKRNHGRKLREVMDAEIDISDVMQ